MKTLCLSPRMPFAVTLLIGLGLGFGSIILAAVLKIDACPLCIIQRMLHMLLAALAIIGLLVAHSNIGRRIMSFLLAATAATGAFTAAYQSWLQRFAQDVSCTADEPWWEAFVEWASKKLPALFRVSGICSDASFKIFGFSLAEWSLVGFVFLFLLAMFSLFRNTRLATRLCPFACAK